MMMTMRIHWNSRDGSMESDNSSFDHSKESTLVEGFGQLDLVTPLMDIDMKKNPMKSCLRVIPGILWPHHRWKSNAVHYLYHRDSPPLSLDHHGAWHGSCFQLLRCVDCEKY